MAKIADAEETEAQEAAIRKRRGEKSSQLGGDVIMEGASDGGRTEGGRTEEDYDGLVS